jgi:MFS family permease
VLVSGAIPRERISTGMGIYALSTVVVQAFAPMIGLRLVALYGYNTTFAVAAALVAATMVYTALVRLELETRTRPFRISIDSIFSWAVIVPAFILLVEAMVWSQINAFLVLFGKDRGLPIDKIGLFFTVLAFGLIVSRPLIGYLADRLGSSKVLLASMSFLAGSFLLISWSYSLPTFLVAAAVAAFGYAGCQPALMAVCLRRVPAERRGAASCTAYMGQDIGNLLGGVLGGLLVQNLGYAAMWRLMLVPLAIAAVVTIVFRHHINAVAPAAA